jgi:hypothetical protein
MRPRKLARLLRRVPPLIVRCPRCGAQELLDSPLLCLMVRSGDVVCADCLEAQRGRVELVPVKLEDLT